VTGPVLHRGSVVSSSRIRKSIQDASFAEAGEMLLEDHSLDLRDLPVTPGGPGVSLIPRSAVSQVLPRSGRYPVACAGQDGAVRCRGELTVGEDLLVLACASGAESATVMFEQFEQ